MNINSTPVSNLTTRVSIEIENNDVAPKVAQELKRIRQKMQVPGFRIGHAPMGMVKRQYEPSVLMEQLNTIVSKELDEFISNNIPNTILEPIFENSDKIDINQEQYVFNFLVAQRPDIEVNLEQYALTRYVADPPEDEVKKHLESIYNSRPDVSSFDEFSEEVTPTGVAVVFVPVAGEDSENLEEASETISFDNLNDEVKELLKGKKAGFQFEKTVGELFGEDVPQAFGGFEKEDALALEVVNFEVSSPASFSEDLVIDVFGPAEGENIKSEEDLIEKIKTDFRNSILEQSKILLTNQWYDQVTQADAMELPEDAIKQWLNQRIDEQNIELDEAGRADEYSRTLKYLRYNLTMDAIVEKFGIKITRDDIANQMVENYKRQYGALVLQLGEEFLKTLIDKDMKNKETVDRINSELLMERLGDLLIEKGNIAEDTIAYEDFVKKLQEQN